MIMVSAVICHYEGGEHSAILLQEKCARADGIIEALLRNVVLA